MRKLLLVLLSSLLLIGCATETAPTEKVEETKEEVQEETNEEDVEEEKEEVVATVKILSPQGAPALSLIPIINEAKHLVNTVGGADVIQAELAQKSPNYDVILAPTNLGVKLAATGNSDYLLYAIVDYGNLYLVGNSDADLNNASIAAFGENAVPGLVYAKTYESLLENTTFYNDVSEAREMLLSGNAEVALLAEPAATATIAAAKKEGKELKILSNVQAEWGDDGFPMAGMFVQKDFYENNKEVIEVIYEAMKSYSEGINMDDTTELVNDINNGGIELYGVPNAEIIGKCYDRINIDIKKASDCVDDIAEFLKLFGVEDVKGTIIE